MNPIIALSLGSFLNGEELSSWALGCSIVIVFAVVLIISAKARAQKIDMGDSKDDDAVEPVHNIGDGTEPACQCG